MPYDITMCGGENCPLKNNCYRFTGEILARQDFFGSLPYNQKTNECEHFYDNKHQIAEIAFVIWEKDGKPNGKDKIHWEEAKKELKIF
ncbi:MAG: DUF2934 domain-containing protein [Cytophagales bacterium]|nr:MAG: DUF2934 domain-containing protein [Cytophagales bacterium]